MNVINALIDSLGVIETNWNEEEGKEQKPNSNLLQKREKWMSKNIFPPFISRGGILKLEIMDTGTLFNLFM
jgi:hypothetical protein